MAHADIDLKNPPGRRLGAVVLVRDRQERVLLVKPTYNDKLWQLPGGGAHPHEPIAAAAARELKEETGLTRTISHCVAVDYVPFNPENGVAEGINVVCDAGTLDDDEAAAVAIPVDAAHELEACRWVWPRELDEYVKPYQARRIREALDAIDRGNELPILVLGQNVVQVA